MWDGSGIFIPQVTQYVKSQLRKKILFHLCGGCLYMKGMTHEVDFKLWFKEHGLFTVDDIFGEQHLLMMDIIVNVFYKGYKYFNKDWDLYLGEV